MSVLLKDIRWLLKTNTNTLIYLSMIWSLGPIDACVQEGITYRFRKHLCHAHFIPLLWQDGKFILFLYLFFYNKMLRQHIDYSRVCVLFTLFVFVCAKWCPIHIVLCFFRLVFPMLPVSLDCSILIVPSVFSNVYLKV